MIITRGKTLREGHFEPVPPVIDGKESRPENRYLRYLRRNCPTAKNFEHTLSSVFAAASREVTSISSDRGTLGGTPCVQGTRVPVYMILDAIEYYGNLEGVLQSYPQLNIDNVKEAVRFVKHVMECPIDNQI